MRVKLIGSEHDDKTPNYIIGWASWFYYIAKDFHKKKRLKNQTKLTLKACH